MASKDFTYTLLADQSPKEMFNAINNVRGWWSEGIEGGTQQLNDEFTYRYKDVHHCKLKVVEMVPEKKVVWKVLDNYFSFTKDKEEWINTTITFDILKKGDKTELRFTHQGLVPQYECYDACSDGWTFYLQQSLLNLVATGKGQPNSANTASTIYEVVTRFMNLAREEKWFEIHDELFADNVKSIEPEGSPYMKNAQGKAAVRKKGEDFVSKIEAGHRFFTSEPIVSGNHFAVGREMDITVKGHGRIQISEIMMYEVKDGQIVSEQFFY